MKIRISYWKRSVKYQKIFEEMNQDFLAGLSAVPYLFSESPQHLLQVDCFYKETWQTYGGYDLVRGYIFPFIDFPNKRILRGRSSLEPIPEGNYCLVVTKSGSRRFIKITDQFIQGLRYYQEEVDPSLKITIISGE